MKKRLIASLFMLSGSLASAFSVGVIVPYEDDTEKPLEEQQLTGEQKKKEALFRERLKQRDAKRLETKKAQEKFEREHRKKRVQEP
jgi:hypothetical protein